MPTASSSDASTPHKLNAYLLKAAVVAGLGGLLFGFDTAVISGTTGDLTQVYNLSPLKLGVTVFAALVGTILGSMFAGIPGDKFGRRDSLRVMAVLYVVSALGCALAWNWPALVFFRFIGGLAIGGSSVLGPMYIAEIAPASWRGRLVGIFQFNVVSGILLAYLSNFFGGAQHLRIEDEWRWKFGVATLPAVLFLTLLFTIPRSPRWLVKKQRINEAREVLRLIGEQDYERELDDIVESIDAEHGLPDEALFSAKYRLPIFLAITIGMFNQLSGINAILYYLNDIFTFAQRSVIWVYLSEVFPNRVRAKGQSLGTLTHWLMNAAISLTFPILAARSKSIPFMFFAAMMLLEFFVVLFVYPETKGVTLEEMQKKLHV